MFLGQHIRPGTPGRKDGLQIRAGGGHHKIPGHRTKGLEDRIRILLSRGVPGDDDGPGF